MKEICIINPEDVSSQEVAIYKTREASRAVVFDSDRNVALLHVTNKNYYKLPGGGIDKGESEIEALKRECQEEIGCTISNIKEIGIITEYRKMFELKQISYCYIAKVTGKKEVPEFTNSEIADGFEVVWMPAEDAKNILERSKTENKEGSLYIVPRDLKILEEAGGCKLKHTNHP